MPTEKQIEAAHKKASDILDTYVTWEEMIAILTAAEQAESATICVACEGKPSPENNPCAVCGKKAEPATGVEPEELRKWRDDELRRVRDGSFITRPPESRLREALEGLLAPFSDDPCRIDHHGYCQAHFLELHCCVAKARAALAQEDRR